VTPLIIAQITRGMKRVACWMLGHKVPTTTSTGTTTNVYLAAAEFVIHLLCFWVRWWVRHFWLPSGVPHIPVLPPHSQRTVTLSSTSPANDGWRSPGNIAVVLAVVLVVELVLVLFMSEKRGKKEQVWSPPSSAGLVGGWS
jgi:hypothetical protein